MPDRYFFADEAGCFAFNRGQNVSKYFILCTISCSTCGMGVDLLELRRELAYDGVELGEYFHATKDKQAVRDRVFSTISKHDFTIQATIMEKSKAFDRIRADKPTFYKFGWYYHFKYGAAKEIPAKAKTLITAASIGTGRERGAFRTAVNDVMSQTVGHAEWRTDFPPAGTDPCVQAADYCAWAMQRKWERGDTRSYDLIRPRITYEYDLWAHGNKHHY